MNLDPFNLISQTVDAESVRKITSISPLIRLVQDTVIAYEGQIPNFAVLLAQGSVCVEQKVEQIFAKPVIVFLDQVQKEDVALDQVSILKGAEIAILDRAILKELRRLQVIT